jgi:hypothetical protein
MAITAQFTEKTEKQAAFDYNVPVEYPAEESSRRTDRSFITILNLPACFASVKNLNADRARGHQDISAA